MKKFVLAIDQGTTGTTALLIDSESFEIVGKINREFKQIFPKPGEVEHDLNEIWQTVQDTTTDVLVHNNIKAEQIISIGITNQRETTCAYDKAGTPLHNAIVWQDRRTSSYCDERRKDYSPLQIKTGLPLDPYFSATKISWLLNHSSEVKVAAKNNNLNFSTIDSFLVYKMTNCHSFVTEPSNASRTLLMDLDTCEWDNDLLSFFNISRSYLPTIKESFTNFGYTEGLGFLPDGIPISCILGDQQAALFGQGAYKAGELKCTYGTGAFILLNTGTEKTFSSNGLLTTVAYKKDGKACYALEGSCYIAGAAVQWLRDNLGIIETSPDVEYLAGGVQDLNSLEHLIFFPYFTGMGSPYWNAEAKGAIMGITRDTSKAHIARACLDGLALSVNDSIQAIISDSPLPVREIKVDGGACKNNLLMQIQANFSKLRIIRPKIVETTAYGVALGALVGLDKITFSEIDDLWQEDTIFVQESNKNYYENKSKQWKSLITKIY